MPAFAGMTTLLGLLIRLLRPRHLGQQRRLAMPTLERPSRIAAHPLARADIACHAGPRRQPRARADAEMIADADLAADQDHRAHRGGAADADLCHQKTVMADMHIVADMDQAVETHAVLDMG